MLDTRFLGFVPHFRRSEGNVNSFRLRVYSEWSRRDSNARHLPCKGSALPTELRPRGKGYFLEIGAALPRLGGGQRRQPFTGFYRRISVPQGLKPRKFPSAFGFPPFYYSLISSFTVMPAGIIGRTCSW